MELLMKHYEGQLVDFDNIKTDELHEMKNRNADQQSKTSGKGLADEKIKPKKKEHIKPILQKLSERKPAPIHYLGTSFGLTKELF